MRSRPIVGSFKASMPESKIARLGSAHDMTGPENSTQAPWPPNNHDNLLSLVLPLD